MSLSCFAGATSRREPRRLLLLALLATAFLAVTGTAMTGTASAGAAPAGAAVAGPGDPIRVELNAAENAQSRCRLSFVIENKSEAAIDSLKLDLAVFGRDGVIQRRLVTDMGPIRAAKTIVKAFELDGECGQIGSILVNDVTACAPGEPGACLERLALSSRLPTVRLFK